MLAGRFMGRGDKEGADQAAVNAMRLVLKTVDMNGVIVIGEGEKDKAPMLFNGEMVGNGSQPDVDVAVDPIDGTRPLAFGRSNSLAMVAVAPRGTMFDPGPFLYMNKIAVGPEAKGRIDIEKSITYNLKAIARAKGRAVEDLTTIILDRPRHDEMIAEIRKAGARIREIPDGDVAAALMTGVVARMAGDDIAAVGELFKGLVGYALTIVLGLALIVVVIYPAMMSLLMRRNVYKDFLRAISPAQLLAFSTSSSAATLPATIRCVEENIGVSKATAGFVLPVGATVNMDGTSLMQAVAVIFLAQLHMVDLTLGQQLTIVLTATLASIGAAAIPSGGMMLMVVVLSSLGLDPAWVAIVFTIDRPLDMMRTVVNVTGDAAVCSVVAHSQGEKLFMDKEKLEAA